MSDATRDYLESQIEGLRDRWAELDVRKLKGNVYDAAGHLRVKKIQAHTSDVEMLEVLGLLYYLLCQTMSRQEAYADLKAMLINGWEDEVENHCDVLPLRSPSERERELLAVADVPATMKRIVAMTGLEVL